MEDVARWAKWVVLACVIVGVVGLITVAVLYTSQQRRTEELRQKWDEVYTATKEKTKLNDRIQALEAIAPKIAGTPAHAYVLTELGNIYFEEATNAKKSREERAEALDKSTKLFELVATNEPFKSNPAFGPVAARSAALAYEQAGNYDAAIKLLNDALAQNDIEQHYLYNPMVAQLGREYWLRSLNKIKENKDPESDRKDAREQLSKALRSTATRDDQGWRGEAEFIKALIDKPGKALPDGKVPPEKAPPAPAPKAEGEKKDGAQATDTKDDAKVPADAAKTDNKTPPAPAEVKKTDEKKPDEKKDDKNIKKDDAKKDGSIQLPNLDSDPASVPASASGHLSFSQVQKMLKEGRPAFCNCPRCQAGNAPPAGVRMAE
jgi:tetratricopeptide (TPR) repeat protein